jgi:gliding motility-associated-like protein
MKKHFSNFLHQLAEQHLRRLSGVMFFVLLLSGYTVFSQTPGITSIEPAKAFYGQTITITGSGFAATADLLVKFGGARAAITASTPTTITVTVPAGATYAPVTVTNLPSGLTAYSSQFFLLSFGGTEDGDVQFDALQAYSATGLYDVCACDLDGDGKNDLAGSSSTSTSVTTFLNSSSIGNINFAGRQIFTGSRTYNVSCSDLDGDGKADLLFTGTGTDVSKVIILKNTSTPGNLSFAAPQTLNVSQKSLAKPAIQDLDGDGKPEIILTNHSDAQIVVFKNTSVVGTINFNADFQSFTVPVASTQGLRVKDVNNDGLADITVSGLYGNNVYFLLNNSTPGNITFQSPASISASNLYNHELADIDSDGKQDLITLDYNAGLTSIHLNNSSEETALSFAAAQSFATASMPTGLELGDFNGDKKVDILVGHNTEAKAYLLVNTSTPGTLSFNTLILSGSGKFTNVQVSDVDGDAIPDAIIADKEGGIVNIFRNKTCIFPAVTPSGELDICDGSSVTLSTVQSPKTEGTSPTITYQWLKDGVAVDGATGHALTTTTAGNYVIEMTATDGECSTTSNTVSVIDFEESLAGTTFEPVTMACEAQPLTLAISSIKEGASYTWTNAETGFEAVTTTNSLTIEEADQALHSGIYTLTIAKSGCSISFYSEEITIQPKPVATISADGSLLICQGESRVLSTAEGFAAYQWKKDGQAISGATSASYNASEGGAYTVLVKNTNNCEAESEATTIEEAANMEVAFEAPQVACVNQPVQFTDQSVLATGKTATYVWDFGDGSQSTDPSPTHIYTQISATPLTVTLRVKYEDSGCSSTYSSTISVKEAPEVAIEIADGSTGFCVGDSVKVQISGNVSAVNWSNGASGIFTYAKEEGILQADVLTASGCILTKAIEITEFPLPLLKVSAAKMVISPGETVQLQAEGGTSYSWEPAESLNNPGIANPLASPLETTTYKVTATGENGCAVSAEITIEVDASFKVEAPKLFVPAVDQSWIVNNIESYSEVSLLIINKFGSTLFTASPYKNDWSGTAQGKELNGGVYYYVFKDASGKILKSGSITLVR